MFRGSLIALLVAALATGFLGGRLTTSGQGTEVEALQQAVAQLSQRIAKLETGMAAAGEFQALTGRVASLEEGLAEQQSTTSGQGTEIEALKRTIAPLSQKLGELETGMVAPEDFQGLSDRVAALEENLREERAATGEQGADIEALNQTLAQLSQKVEQLEIGIARAATVKELQGLADQIATLEEQLQGQWEGRFEELQVKLDELAAEVEAGAERKLKIGYVDMFRVSQKLQQREFGGPEQFETALTALQGMIQEIAEEGGYDLIIQFTQWQNNTILYPQAKSIADLTDQVIEALEQQ